MGVLFGVANGEGMVAHVMTDNVVWLCGQECNMYRLGFCVYGPQCRYKHTRLPGPVPEPETVEAAKPREFRNINLVVNTVNRGIAGGSDRQGGFQRGPRYGRS